MASPLRRPLLAGNWKMNLTLAQSVELAKLVAAAVIGMRVGDDDALHILDLQTQLREAGLPSQALVELDRVLAGIDKSQILPKNLEGVPSAPSRSRSRRSGRRGGRLACCLPPNPEDGEVGTEHPAKVAAVARIRPGQRSPGVAAGRGLDD